MYITNSTLPPRPRFFAVICYSSDALGPSGFLTCTSGAAAASRILSGSSSWASLSQRFLTCFSLDWLPARLLNHEHPVTSYPGGSLWLSCCSCITSFSFWFIYTLTRWPVFSGSFLKGSFGRYHMRPRMSGNILADRKFFSFRILKASLHCPLPPGGVSLKPFRFPVLCMWPFLPLKVVGSSLVLSVLKFHGFVPWCWCVFSSGAALSCPSVCTFSWSYLFVNSFFPFSWSSVLDLCYRNIGPPGNANLSLLLFSFCLFVRFS